MTAVENLSEEDKEFLKHCEDLFKDRYTEKDAEFMKVFNADPSIPPIVQPWWVSQNAGRRNDNRRNRRYEGNRDFGRRDYRDRRDNDRRDYNERRDYNDRRGYNDYNRGYDRRSGGYGNRQYRQ